MAQNEVRTTCPYCGVGCGVLARVDEAGGVTVKGDPAHPANHGRLCSKGAALGETVDLEGRLLYPEIRGKRASWEQALERVASGFQSAIEQYGPDSVAFYVSGQLLTEDYYVANKLMKGFIGSANIDTNSRLCMSSAVTGYKRAFGSDTVPCSYTDLERAKLIVLAGSNAAWCHPVLYQRIVRAKKDNPDLLVVVIDPRYTNTCDSADLHLPIAPGTDATLFNGLLVHLQEQGEMNALFVQQATQGATEALAAARIDAPDLAAVALRCGLPQDSVAAFYKLFARTERVVTVFSQGINQFSMGTDKVNSIINCHLLTGRIGRPGMGPFSFTGQPNAMGGREVGGLANQLAAHMELENPAHRDRVQRFWSSPRMAEKPGLKAVDLFQAVREGRIKALWIMATNPAVSLPDSKRMREAMQGCDFLVVSDCMRETDTTAYAHVLLPAQAWGERNGMVTNSERCLSRQRAFLPAPGESRPDWLIITEVACRLGYAKAFPYTDPQQVFREHAALSTYENNGSRDFDLAALGAISVADYEGFIPRQWPMPAQPGARLFADGRFYTASGKAQLIPIARRNPVHETNLQYPLILNTGRVRDQWHTMTRSGKSARLAGHRIEPYAEMHPEDAVQYAIAEGGLVCLQSPWGEAVVRARISGEQRKGSIFVPIHWNQQFSSLATVDLLTSQATDPLSGQPEFKFTPLRMAPYKVGWYGFLLSRRRLTLQHSNYWACARGKGLWRYEIAGREAPGDWAQMARSLLCTKNESVEWMEYSDTAAPRYRAARIQEGLLESCIFIGPTPALPERDWLQTLFDQPVLSDADRMSLLTGKPGDGRHDVGRIICACFGVGRNTLLEAIAQQGCDTPEALGQRLRAGTNCGSCVPELRHLIAEVKQG